MKCVILAGGLGTRLAEETTTKPKPMVKIGNYPIILHIMKIYRSHGIKEFVICTGYKHTIILNYFKKFLIKKNKNICEYYDHINDLKISCIYTGKKTNTAGRILKIKSFLKGEKKFFLTYGDGLSDINIKSTLKIFDEKKYCALVSAVKPPARYGVLIFKKNIVTNFQEKIDNKNIWINGGFFIFTTEIFKYIKNYSSSLEYEIMPKLIKKRKLISYKHSGFWACMDTLRDKINLNSIWKLKKPYWKNWK
jgi:glucose-1-phosphate cytidylyltransferase